MFKTYEIEDCDCGHYSPVEFNSHDDDGNAMCPNCTKDLLTDTILEMKKGIAELKKLIKNNK